VALALPVLVLLPAAVVVPVSLALLLPVLVNSLAADDDNDVTEPVALDDAVLGDEMANCPE
jgi:hypothetical protein